MPSNKPTWEQANLYTTPLVILLNDTFGVESFEWDPETITKSLADMNIRLTKAAMSRLLVGVMCVTSDRFTTDIRSFIDFCNVMSGSILGGEEFDPADLDETAWGITEYKLLTADSKEPTIFHPEIVGYIEHICQEAGLMRIPKVLQVGDPREPISLPGDFSDDPEMFQAIYQTEELKITDLEAAISDQLQTVLQQVAALNLSNGSTEKVKSMLAKLEGTLS